PTVNYRHALQTIEDQICSRALDRDNLPASRISQRLVLNKSARMRTIQLDPTSAGCQRNATIAHFPWAAASSVCALAAALLLAKAGPGFAASAAPGAIGQHVNPFIGTGGVSYLCGNEFPGACVPFGMVRLSPDTISDSGRRATNTSGYYYRDSRIL